MIKFVSTLGYLIALAGLLILIQKHYIISENPIVITIQVLSFALMVWSRITFGARSFHLTANTTKGELVTKGPYKLLRHPIYAAVIYFSWASIISFPLLWTIIACVMVSGGLYLRMILEEKSLRETYPNYTEYTKKAKRLIPFVL